MDQFCYYFWKYIYIYIYTYISILGGHSNCALGTPSPRMQAYDEAKADPKIKNPCSHVEKMKLPGFFRCCIFRWKKPREDQKWTLLCHACPHLAKRYKEPPNILRRIIGHEVKCKHRLTEDGGTSCLPPEFESAITSCVVPRTEVEWCIKYYIYIEYYIYIYIYIVCIRYIYNYTGFHECLVYVCVQKVRMPYVCVNICIYLYKKLID